jgi:hypothetical protein
MKKKTIFALAFIALAALLYGQNAGDFVVQGKVLTKYQGTATAVTIPANLGVTEIGEEAFAETNIISVVIPAGVTSIGDYAFYKCRSLTGITIPAGVTAIGGRAFYECSSLTAITIPAGVTSIGDYAFYECTSLTGITIPASVTKVGDGAFYDCSSLAEITVDGRNPAYTSVNGVLFDKAKTKLVQYPQGKRGAYSIPAGVTAIEGNAFFRCVSLTAITIPAGVTETGISAIYGCSGLTEITVDERNPAYSSVNGVLFDKAKTKLVQYPQGKRGAYSIPAGVTAIEGNAFFRCVSLTAITIPAGVTSIGDYAFNGCNRLTDITIPASVTSIGNGAFYDCVSLAEITVDGRNPAYSSVNGVLFDKAKTKLLRYPQGKQGETYSIPAGVTEIGVSAFYDCVSLTAITIPPSVTEAGYMAFFNCPFPLAMKEELVKRFGGHIFNEARGL